MLKNKIGILVCLVALGFVSLSCQGRQPIRSTEPAATKSVSALAPGHMTVRVKILQEQGGRVSWQGRQNLIAFDSGGYEGRTEVYSVRLDGSDKRCLTCGRTDLPQLQNGNPEWHPSCDFIVFQAQDPGLKLPPGPIGNFMASPGIGINNNIWLMKADGSQFWQVTRVQNRSGVLHPQFSADGKKICWSEIIRPGGRLGGQWAVKLGDFLVEKGEPVVKNIQTLTPGSFELYETHGFSPDNKKLIFTVVPPGKYYFDMEIYTYDLSTQQLTRLTEDAEWDEHAHYSPDGKWIAWMSSAGIPQVKTRSFLEMARNPLKTDVWIMKADGSDKRRLTWFNDPKAPEARLAPRGLIVGDISWGPDNKSFAAKIQRGRIESIVLVESEP
ncbi:MAG: PD40 domain-containing protein [Deltaproteobacteria bacterium]|nr:PD40 domain-containing protein [Deltaproteobacteria bacterium]